MGALSPDQRSFLSEQRNAILATNRRDAAPQVSPVWYLWDGERILISTDVTTAKVANVRRDPRVTVCIDDPATGRYAAVTGHATLIEGAEVREPTLALIRKYRDEEREVIAHWERISSLNERVLISVDGTDWYWRGF